MGFNGGMDLKWNILPDNFREALKTICANFGYDSTLNFKVFD